MSFLRKEYILVSSDYRDTSSESATDFNIHMLVPVRNVVKTDVIEVALDDVTYFNIRAPDNQIVLHENYTGSPPIVNVSTIEIPEGYYTLASLISKLQAISPANLTAVLNPSSNGIQFRYTPAAGFISSFLLMRTESKLWLILNARSRRGGGVGYLIMVQDGGHPPYDPIEVATWTCGAINLTPKPRYMLLQSRNLGTDILTAGATNGFWRMIMFDPASPSTTVEVTNSRVDSYYQTPRMLQDIDVKLVFPDGSPVQTSGSFTLLLEIVRDMTL